MKATLRIIGDVHGKKERYLKRCSKAEHTIQLGDHDFGYGHLKKLDSSKHKILGGNHDNYDTITYWPHYLGDYGIHHVPNFGDIFFVRGGFSIDKALRTEGVDWWQGEEMSMGKCYDALAEYGVVKPEFVVSHECPTDAVPFVTKFGKVIKTRTNQLLNRMFATHQPKIWVFAHFHVSRKFTIGNTQFVCLNELECLDLGVSS